MGPDLVIIIESEDGPTCVVCSEASWLVKLRWGPVLVYCVHVGSVRGGMARVSIPMLSLLSVHMEMETRRPTNHRAQALL